MSQCWEAQYMHHSMEMCLGPWPQSYKARGRVFIKCMAILILYKSLIAANVKRHHRHQASAPRMYSIRLETSNGQDEKTVYNSKHGWVLSQDQVPSLSSQCIFNRRSWMHQKPTQSGLICLIFKVQDFSFLIPYVISLTYCTGAISKGYIFLFL